MMKNVEVLEVLAVIKNGDMCFQKGEGELMEYKHIYISYPYTAETNTEILGNVYKVANIANELMKRGYVPLFTHMSYFTDEIAKAHGINFSYDDWLDYCLEIESRADAILYLGDSKGCRRELKYALENDIKVFLSIDDLEDANSIDVVTDNPAYIPFQYTYTSVSNEPYCSVITTNIDINTSKS